MTRSSSPASSSSSSFEAMAFPFATCHVQRKGSGICSGSCEGGDERPQRQWLAMISRYQVRLMTWLAVNFNLSLTRRTKTTRRCSSMRSEKSAPTPAPQAFWRGSAITRSASTRSQCKHRQWQCKHPQCKHPQWQCKHPQWHCKHPQCKHRQGKHPQWQCKHPQCKHRQGKHRQGKHGQCKHLQCKSTRSAGSNKGVSVRAPTGLHSRL